MRGRVVLYATLWSLVQASGLRSHAVVNGTRYLSSYLDHPGWFLASMALLMAWVA
jgi:hypothetical protein